MEVGLRFANLDMGRVSEKESEAAVRNGSMPVCIA